MMFISSDNGELQSSSAMDLMIKAFVYIRTAVKSVATLRVTANVAIIVLWMFSGSVELGMTPGGGWGRVITMVNMRLASYNKDSSEPRHLGLSTATYQAQLILNPRGKTNCI